MAIDKNQAKVISFYNSQKAGEAEVVTEQEYDHMVQVADKDVFAAIKEYDLLRERYTIGRGLAARILNLFSKAMLRRPYVNSADTLIRKKRNHVENEHHKLDRIMKDMDSTIVRLYGYMDNTTNSLECELKRSEEADEYRKKHQGNYQVLSEIVNNPGRYSDREYFEAMKASGRLFKEYGVRTRDYFCGTNNVKTLKGIYKGTNKVVNGLEMIYVVNQRYSDSLGHMLGFIKQMEHIITLIPELVGQQIKGHSEYLELHAMFSDLRESMVRINDAHINSTAKLTGLDPRFLNGNKYDQ
jgi:hypothetical protein